MKHNDSRPGFAIERIGELMFTPITRGGADFGAVVAQDFDVKVEYLYAPEYVSEDGAEPAGLTIKAIRADANVHFDGEGVSFTANRGVDLMALFSRIQVGALEDKLLAGIERGGAQ